MNAQNDNDMNGKIIAISCYALNSLILGAISSYFDETGNFSFKSVILSFALGISINVFASRNKIIFNFAKWTLNLCIYMLMSYIIFLWFWYFPLYSLGDLRTATQMAEYQDANYYDYLAELASLSNYSDWLAIINATWLSQGVVAYLAIIYKYLGVSQFNYFFINIILGYFSIIFIQAIISISIKRDIANIALLIPFVVYYNVTPGKEVLTNLFTYSTLYYLFLAWNKRLNVGFDYVILFILVILLALVRLNAGIMVVGVFAAYCFVYSLNKKAIFFKSILIGIIALYIFYLIGLIELVMSILDFATIMSQYDLRLENTDSNSIKYILATSLTSGNFILNLLMSPLRMIIWLVAPFPFLEIYELLQQIFSDNKYNVFRAGEALSRSLSSLIMVYFCVMFFNYFIKNDKKIHCESANYLLIVSLGFTFVLSTSNFIEGARYRVIIEPLAICWVLLIKNMQEKNDIKVDAN